MKNLLRSRTQLTAPVLALVSSVALTACGKQLEARADSLQSAATEQAALNTQLQSQKDSLTRVVLDADSFLTSMDSAIRTVKGMPKGSKKTSDPLANQLQARREVQERVKALVARAKETANQLAELQKRQTQSDSVGSAQAAKIQADAQLIADLGTKIEQQGGQISGLEARLDTLTGEYKNLSTKHFKAYYVIGTEEELLKKGIVVREGGANLLLAHPGRTLQPARVLDASAFTPVDQRELKEIAVPDTTRRYRVISRQSLDAADVAARQGTTFQGNLKIAKPDEFWSASRFLIIQVM